ncbi:YihY/virulence factor BrkB family protein [Cellulosimicrobium arenosum]|uniref:YihY family inner membrane protein n=1 Tax=Cellulosimicrobium arenosum TaxID=2708133 RepID=A0A927J0X2_9MICO|nr:YihY/virulence factor BrkB family protein [Cellulosimicrobium arenosum]MBD8079874.1 YihY family inner membrane protein [Cellulosimicrobium arenosum]
MAETDSTDDAPTRSSLDVLKATFARFSRDQCTDLAAGLTYYAVLASAPALLALVSLLGLVGDPETMVDQVMTTVEDFVPQDMTDQIEPLVANAVGNSGGAGFALILGVVLALWSASGFIGAFGRAMNRVYAVEEGRPIWKLRPVMLLVTVITVVIAALVVGALVLTGPFARTVGELVGLGSTAVTVWGILKWPVVLALVVVLVAILYHVTPNVRKPKFRLFSTGALVAIGVWALASAAFAFYIGSGFASYGATYGTLAGVIIFLLWLWITNLAMLFGAELDAELERTRELRAGMAAEESLQLRPKDTSAIEKRAAKRQDDVDKAREVRVAARAEDQAEARAEDETTRP